MRSYGVSVLFCFLGLSSLIQCASTKMIGRSTPLPLSMKTTPRLFGVFAQSEYVVAVFIEGGGHDHPIKTVLKTVIVRSLRVLSLEWLGLRPDRVKEVCN